MWDMVKTSRDNHQLPLFWKTIGHEAPSIALSLPDKNKHWKEKGTGARWLRSLKAMLEQQRRITWGGL